MPISQETGNVTKATGLGMIGFAKVFKNETRSAGSFRGPF